jgi:hypothetical protein
MIHTRIPSHFGLFPLLAIACAPAPVEPPQSAVLDDDVVDYVPADRSVGIKAASDQPEVMESPLDILAIAEAEEGNSLDQVGVSTGYPLSTYAGAAPGGWCSEFVSWAYWRGGCPFTGQRGTYSWMIGGSTQIRQWFVTNSRFVYQTDAEWASYEPQPGEYIRYNTPDGGHSGIVRYADGTTLYTVEGNVNSKVMLRTLRNYKTAYADSADGIDGFGVMAADQCGSTGGTGGAAGTGGSGGAGGAVGTGGSAGTSAGGRAGGSTNAGGAAGSAGNGGRTATGGRGPGAGGTAVTGGVTGRGGGGGAVGTGGSAGTGGTGGTAGGSAGTGGVVDTTATSGRAGAGGAADTGGGGGVAGASGGTRGGSTGSAGAGGATGGAAGAGGTSEGASTKTGASGNKAASTAATTTGCNCSTGRGPGAAHGLWLLGLTALLAAGRRRRERPSVAELPHRRRACGGIAITRD